MFRERRGISKNYIAWSGGRNQRLLFFRPFGTFGLNQNAKPPVKTGGYPPRRAGTYAVPNGTENVLYLLFLRHAVVEQDATVALDDGGAGFGAGVGVPVIAVS